MKLVEIDATTEDTFLRCLHDEIPADPRVMAMRREWRAIHRPLGHRAKVLLDDADRVVGLTNYIPIEHSPYEGENLMAILCMWIHGYDHLVGNQQAKGYGRYMLACIERDAEDSGCDGVTVWGKDYQEWNPVSFYEHMGYERVDRRGLDVLAWKPFNDRARPPRFVERRTLEQGEVTPSGSVQVTSFTSGWCGGGCHQCVTARDAVAGLGDRVRLVEIRPQDKDDLRQRGESIDALYVDGEPYRPDGPPFTARDLAQTLRETFERKNAGPGAGVD